MYVWLDALMNYITALGYGEDDANDGEKMSKSKGNVVAPKEVCDLYGVENFRYFMLREVPFGQDGDFSKRALIDRGMSEKYSDLHIDSKDVLKYHSSELDKTVEIISTLPSYIDKLQFHKYLEELWKVFSIANKAIEEYTPWVKVKENKTEEALATIALVANILAQASIFLYPIMPKTTSIIADTLSFSIDTNSYESLIVKKELLSPFLIKKTPPLFPRIEDEVDAEIEPAKKDTVKTELKSQSDDGLIEIGQFFQTSLKVGTVIDAVEVAKSKKLLRLKVDLAENEPRQIIAGIKEFYTPKELIGTQVCVVANLKPAKLMGLVSEGMLLAAKDESGLSLLRIESYKKEGTTIG